jgi:endogenous inhibitor of DNA gyrase (YacG/DUF329 family)
MSCPLCKKPTDAEFRPFCSRHCADLDLHRWLSGRYAIPAAQDDEEDEEGQGFAAGHSED